MFLGNTLEEYLDRAASGEEIPGGGSVSAVVAALGGAMASMAANFTAGRKKFAAVEEEVQEMLRVLCEQRKLLQACIEDDSRAFLKFGEVYAMPKSNEEEKQAREAAMQQALRGALEPPLRIMRAALAALEPLPRLADIGNQNLISDTGVAAIMLRAGLHGARLNVAVNLKFIKDEEFCANVGAEVSDILARAEELAERTLRVVSAAVL